MNRMRIWTPRVRPAIIAAAMAVLVTYCYMPCIAAEDQQPIPKVTCEATYPGLLPGTLREATLFDLPAETLAEWNGRTYQQKDIDDAVKAMPENTPKELKEAGILILEQIVTEDLLLAEARQRGLGPDEATAKHDKASGLDSATPAIQALIKQVADTVTVSEDEIKAAYEAFKDQLEGASYEDTKDSVLRPYLLQQKQEAAVTKFVSEIGKGKGVQLNSVWAKAQYDKLSQNPVDLARKSGRPVLVDFGSTGCSPCEMLAPILKELTKTYAGKIDVVVILVGEHPVLTQRYGISTIPLQIFYDAKGQELWRHIGFIDRETIVAKFKELGMTE